MYTRCHGSSGSYVILRHHFEANCSVCSCDEQLEWRKIRVHTLDGSATYFSLYFVREPTWKESASLLKVIFATTTFPLLGTLCCVLHLKPGLTLEKCGTVVYQFCLICNSQQSLANEVKGHLIMLTFAL